MDSYKIYPVGAKFLNSTRSFFGKWDNLKKLVWDPRVLLPENISKVTTLQFDTAVLKGFSPGVPHLIFLVKESKTKFSKSTNYSKFKYIRQKFLLLKIIQ